MENKTRKSLGNLSYEELIHSCAPRQSYKDALGQGGYDNFMYPEPLQIIRSIGPAKSCNIVAGINEESPLIINGVKFTIKIVRDERSGEPMIMVTGNGHYCSIPVSGNTVVWDGNDWSNTLTVYDSSHSYIGIYHISIYTESGQGEIADHELGDLRIQIAVIKELA